MSRSNHERWSEELEKAAAAWVFRREAGLTPEEEAEFGRWRAADPRHAAVLARHERAWSILDRPRQAGQVGFLLQRMSERASRRRRFAAACGAFIVLLAAGAIWQVGRPRSAAFAGPRTFVVRPEMQILADGSVVELKSGAEIATDFSGPFRRVVLRRGEAHFQVAKSPRPFVVAVGAVEFRAVGTSFAVQITSSRVELLVTEGRVAVEKAVETPLPVQPSAALPAVVSPPAAPIMLATVDAGSRMVVGLQSAAPLVPPIAVAVAEVAERLAWRAPKLEFTTTPLAEAVALMNQHNPVQIVIEDAELARLPVSGLFRADRTEALVRILEANFSVTAEQSGGTIRLKRAR